LVLIVVVVAVIASAVAIAVTYTPGGSVSFETMSIQNGVVADEIVCHNESFPVHSTVSVSWTVTPSTWGATLIVQTFNGSSYPIQDFRTFGSNGTPSTFRALPGEYVFCSSLALAEMSKAPQNTTTTVNWSVAWSFVL
jgi:hypothetical protein